MVRIKSGSDSQFSLQRFGKQIMTMQSHNMQGMPKLIVVRPVYDVEKNLSVSHQAFKTLERCSHSSDLNI